nr:MAG TPA: hypothetical protein [Caudoviricetes sp.]
MIKLSKFCGGIKLDDTFKIIKGIICVANATTVDATKAVSTCGQRWDGALFTVSNKVVTLHNSEGDEVGTPTPIKGNCGVGLDGRFFKLSNGIVSLQDGFVLTINTTPADATIKVTDVDSAEIAPITGTTNTFLLSGLGDSYTLTVSKTGYTTKTQTVVNNGDQTVEIILEAAGG